MPTKLQLKKVLNRFFKSHAAFLWVGTATRAVLRFRFRLCARVRSEILLRQLLAVRRSVKKPLLIFYRIGAIGDIICTFPAVFALQKKYPNSHLVYLTLETLTILPKLSGVGPTVLGVRKEVSLPSLSADVVTRVFEPYYSDERPDVGGVSEHLINEFCAACGVRTPSQPPQLHVSDSVVNRINRRFRLNSVPVKKLIAIHTGPSWRVREWPTDHWQTLVRHLVVELNARILHIGAAQHISLGPKAVPKIEGAENLVGKLSLEESAALLSRVDLLVGIDSGMLHVAGAVGTACVGLFGPVNPQYRLPRHSSSMAVVHILPCSFCHHRRPRLHWESGCPHDIACMTALSPEKVFDACKAILEKTAPCSFE